MPDPAENPAHQSTPILNSGVMPSRIRRNKLRGVVMGFISGFVPVFLLIIVGREANDQLTFAGGLASFFAVFILAVIVHEAAHVLAGWAVGFHFNSIQIGPFSLRLEHGLLKARFRRGMTALGYAGMHINRLPRLRRRLFIYLAAGSAANLLCIPATVLLLNNVFPQFEITWVATAAAQFVVISLLLGIMSLFSRSSIAYSDGSRIAMLMRSRDRARRWLCILALGHVHNQGTRAKLWKSSWLRGATSLNDVSTDTFVGHLLAYLSANDKKDVEAAAHHLEKCLELAPILPLSKCYFLAQEAAVFTAWFWDDASLSEKWVKQLPKRDGLPQLAKIKLQIATSCARRDFVEAISGWQEGRAFIEQKTAGTARTLITESWLEWQAEIMERRDQLAHVKSAEQPSSIAL